MKFPEFKPIEIGDRAFIQNKLWNYQPQTSELTFTNLFIWRSHYGLQWSEYRDWLLIICTAVIDRIFALPPIGPSPRSDVSCTLLQWIRDQWDTRKPCIERADNRIIGEIEGAAEVDAEPIRDHFDYVYSSQDLIHLAGRKYHSKKNHINSFRQTYSFQYASLQDTDIQKCLGMTAAWCEWRRCEDDMNLMEEWEAVREALIHYSDLQLQGGVILIDDRIEAFTIGELLNKQTAVIHVEKANPEIRGLYALMNQQFCEHNWQHTLYINREQDLGEPGLRQAKLSYHPKRLEKKYRICLRD